VHLGHVAALLAHRLKSDAYGGEREDAGAQAKEHDQPHEPRGSGGAGISAGVVTHGPAPRLPRRSRPAPSSEAGRPCRRG
jgi:hypothetical protein